MLTVTEVEELPMVRLSPKTWIPRLRRCFRISAKCTSHDYMKPQELHVGALVSEVAYPENEYSLTFATKSIMGPRLQVNVGDQTALDGFKERGYTLMYSDLVRLFDEDLDEFILQAKATERKLEL